MILIALGILSYLLGVVFVFQLLKVVSNFVSLSLPVRCFLSLFSWAGLSLAVLYLLFKTAVTITVNFFKATKCEKH